MEICKLKLYKSADHFDSYVVPNDSIISKIFQIFTDIYGINQQVEWKTFYSGYMGQWKIPTDLIQF